MNLLAMYHTWKMTRLLNRILWLISKDNFERADACLSEASALFEDIPDTTKKRKSNLEDLLIEMRKLLGGEFRRKLDKQLCAEERSTVRGHPEITHCHAKSKTAIPYHHKKTITQKRKVVVHKQKTAHVMPTRTVGNLQKGLISERIAAFKKSYPQQWSRRDEVNILKHKIDAWKKQGYDTAALEGQLKGLKK